MAGFGQIVINGKYQLKDVKNVLWYRSITPFNIGNPFDNVVAWVNAVWDYIGHDWLGPFPSTYVVESLTGIGYNDQGVPVTSSPVQITINEYGAETLDNATDGPGLTSILKFNLGDLHAIMGDYQFKKNVGHLSIGPICSKWIGDDGGLDDDFQEKLVLIGNVLKEAIEVPLMVASFVPIRVHHAPADYSPYSTAYSDIIGYEVPTSATFRKSRARRR